MPLSLTTRKRMDFSHFSNGFPSSGATSRKLFGGIMFLLGLADSAWNLANLKEIGAYVVGAGVAIGGALVWIDGRLRDKGIADFKANEDKKRAASDQEIQRQQAEFKQDMDERQAKFKQDMEESEARFNQLMDQKNREAEQAAIADGKLRDLHQRRLDAVMEELKSKIARITELEKDKEFLIGRINGIQLQVNRGDDKRHELGSSVYGEILRVENKAVEVEQKALKIEKVVRTNVINVANLAEKAGEQIIETPKLSDSDEFKQVPPTQD